MALWTFGLLPGCGVLRLIRPEPPRVATWMGNWMGNWPPSSPAAKRPASCAMFFGTTRVRIPSATPRRPIGGPFAGYVARWDVSGSGVAQHRRDGRPLSASYRAGVWASSGRLMQCALATTPRPPTPSADGRRPRIGHSLQPRDRHLQRNLTIRPELAIAGPGQEARQSAFQPSGCSVGETVTRVWASALTSKVS
jgi:hypothetical protein